MIVIGGLGNPFIWCFRGSKTWGLTKGIDVKPNVCLLSFTFVLARSVALRACALRGEALHSCLRYSDFNYLFFSDRSVDQSNNLCLLLHYSCALKTLTMLFKMPGNTMWKKATIFYLLLKSKVKVRRWILLCAILFICRIAVTLNILRDTKRHGSQTSCWRSRCLCSDAFWSSPVVRVILCTTLSSEPSVHLNVIFPLRTVKQLTNTDI